MIPQSVISQMQLFLAQARNDAERVELARLAGRNPADRLRLMRKRDRLHEIARAWEFMIEQARQTNLEEAERARLAREQHDEINRLRRELSGDVGTYRNGVTS